MRAEQDTGPEPSRYQTHSIRNRARDQEPGARSGCEGRLPGNREVATGQKCTGSSARLPPLDRNRSSSFLSTSPAPDPLFEVEHLRLGIEAEPQQKLWREQRHMMAGGTIDLHEVALPEVLDPRGVKGKHSRTFCSWYVPYARRRAHVNGHSTTCSLDFLTALFTDLRRPTDCDRIVATAVSRFGGAHILVK